MNIWSFGNFPSIFLSENKLPDGEIVYGIKFTCSYVFNYFQIYCTRRVLATKGQNPIGIGNGLRFQWNCRMPKIITCHSVHINQNAVHSKIIKHRSKQSWTNKDYNTQFYRKTKWIFYGSPSHGRSTDRITILIRHSHR